MLYQATSVRSLTHALCCACNLNMAQFHRATLAEPCHKRLLDTFLPFLPGVYVSSQPFPLTLVSLSLPNKRENCSSGHSAWKHLCCGGEEHATGRRWGAGQGKVRGGRLLSSVGRRNEALSHEPMAVGKTRHPGEGALSKREARWSRDMKSRTSHRRKQIQPYS